MCVGMIIAILALGFSSKWLQLHIQAEDYKSSMTDGQSTA
jgi:hypothetical protein